MTCRRGTTNRNRRGSSEDRRRRREWLVETYQADVDVTVIVLHGGEVIVRQPDGQYPVYRVVDIAEVRIEPACRCYRCGKLLTVDTVSPDRIIPGCRGGTYRRGNIRPACGACQSETGGALGAAQLAAKRAKGKRVAA